MRDKAPSESVFAFHTSRTPFVHHHRADRRLPTPRRGAACPSCACCGAGTPPAKFSSDAVVPQQPRAGPRGCDASPPGVEHTARLIALIVDQCAAEHTEILQTAQLSYRRHAFAGPKPSRPCASLLSIREVACAEPSVARAEVSGGRWERSG
jgi:hypothetical protein